MIPHKRKNKTDYKIQFLVNPISNDEIKNKIKRKKLNQRTFS
jgi:hypothetical protein